MDSKERLVAQVNTLRQQILNDQNAAFQHQLIIDDYDQLPKDAPKDVHDHFLGAKKAAETELTKCKHRLSLREPLVAELEEKLKAA